MNTKSELIFLNKKDDSIPINFNFNKLSLTNQKKITILKKHLLNSHKIITKEFYFQINNNILIFNDNGTIKKFNDISDYMLNEVISYILNNAKISNIEI